MIFAPNIQRISVAAKACSSGLVLNANSSIKEYLSTPNNVALTNTTSVGGSFYIWFMLRSIEGTQCIYTSVDNGNRCAFLEVTAAGELWAYHTRNTDGTGNNVQIATGIQANTLYQLTYVYVAGSPHRVYLNNQAAVVIGTQLGIYNNNVIVGARRFVDANTPPGTGSAFLGSSGHGFYNHAKITVFEMGFALAANPLNANQVGLLWNNGKGMMAERKRLGSVVWNNLYKLNANRLSGAAFSPIIGTTPLTLTQVGGTQSLSYVNRLGSLIL